MHTEIWFWISKLRCVKKCLRFRALNEIFSLRRAVLLTLEVYGRNTATQRQKVCVDICLGYLITITSKITSSFVPEYVM